MLKGLSKRFGGTTRIESGYAGVPSIPSGSRKLLRPTPTRRKCCCGPRFTCSCSDKTMLVNSSQVEGGEAGVGLPARKFNPPGLRLRATPPLALHLSIPPLADPPHRPTPPSHAHVAP